jgi:hypothetical protein
MGLSVYGLRCLLARRFDETEDFARSLIEPVLQIFNAMLVLDL